MEHISEVSKETLQYWQALLAKHTPKSVKMLTVLSHDVCFDSSALTTWFFNEKTESLCALKHLNSDEKDRQIYVNFFSAQLEHVDDILACLEKHLDFDRGISFEAIEEECWPKVTAFIKQHHGCVSVFPCFKFYDDCIITKTKSEVLSLLDKKLELHPLPSNARVTTVENNKDASLVYTTWKFATKFSLQDILQQVPKKLIMGIYMDNQLVSWIIVDEFGILAKLYTLEPHRGQALALHVLRHSLKRCFELDIPGLAFVQEGNLPSFKLFSKANFKLDSNKVAFILSVPHADHGSCIANVINRVKPGKIQTKSE